MSALAEVPVTPEVAVRRTARGAMAGGGSVSYEVYVDGVWVGWVYDARRFTGVSFRGRRWLATWREADDRAARWTSDEQTSRTAAVAALVARVGRLR